MQSRRASVCESAANLALGYGTSTLLTWWWLGIPPRQAAGASVVFTVASLLRSYGLRRLFARWSA